MKTTHAFLIATLALSAGGLFGQGARQRLGAVSGRVLGPDGQPIQGIPVSAVGADGSSMEQTSDPDGVYRLYDLPAGTYRIKAVPRPIHLPPEIRSDGSAEVRFATTYHPAAVSAESATPVEVQSGAERTGIDIRLVKMPIVAVRGKVTGTPAGVPYLGITSRKVEPRRAPNTGRGGMGRLAWSLDRVNADGSFVLWGLDPGSYVLTVNSNGGGFSSAPRQIEVADKDVSGVAISMAGSSDISGRVVPGDDGARIPPTPPNASLAQSPQIHFLELKGDLISTAVVATDGSFHLANVAPGLYYIRLGWGAYVERIRLGNADIDGSVLDVRNGIGGEALTLTARSATARVSGVIRNASRASADKAVALVSDDIPVLVLGSAIRPDGSYSIRDVPPGKYKLFVHDGRFLMGVKPADYADIAETVEIHSGDTLTRDLRQHASDPK